MNLRAALAVATVAVTFAAGCGGSPETGDRADSTSTTSPLSTTIPEFTLAQWRTAMSEVCDEFEPRQNAAAAQVGTPQSLEQVVEFLDAVKPVADEYLTALEQIPVPAERADDVRRSLELNQANVAVAAAARATAVSGDGPGTQTLLGQLEDQSLELIELLNGLDVPACAKPIDFG